MSSMIIVFGHNGPEVLKMKHLLNKAGAKLDENNSAFGRDTLQALIGFQRQHGLQPDGECGPLTQYALGWDAPVSEVIDLSAWRRTFVNVIRSQIGTMEIGGNNRGPVEKYQRATGNSPGEPYCCSYIYWVCLEIHRLLPDTHIVMPKTASTHELWEWAQSRKRTRSLLDGQPGDVFFMDFGNWRGHVGGIIENEPRGFYPCVEGNTKQRSKGIAQRDGDGVWDTFRRWAEFDGIINIAPDGE